MLWEGLGSEPPMRATHLGDPPVQRWTIKKGVFFEINNKGVGKRMNEDWKGKLKVFVTYAS